MIPSVKILIHCSLSSFIVYLCSLLSFWLFSLMDYSLWYVSLSSCILLFICILIDDQVVIYISCLEAEGNPSMRRCWKLYVDVLATLEVSSVSSRLDVLYTTSLMPVNYQILIEVQWDVLKIIKAYNALSTTLMLASVHQQNAA